MIYINKLRYPSNNFILKFKFILKIKNLNLKNNQNNYKNNKINKTLMLKNKLNKNIIIFEYKKIICINNMRYFNNSLVLKIKYYFKIMNDNLKK